MLFIQRQFSTSETKASSAARSARSEATGLVSRVITTFAMVAFIATGLSARSVVAASATADPSSITIGFIPGENPEKLRENGAEIAELLKDRLGVKANIHVSKDYASLVEDMKNKKVDFAFLSAMTFVFAEKAAGAKVLLKKVWVGPYYHATILVRGDSKITSIAQLKGKRFAFVDQQSASGFLYPKLYFKKKGIDPDKYFSSVVFSGNHEASVRLLKEGKVDGIAVFSNDAKGLDNAWTRFADSGKEVQATQKQKAQPKPRSLWMSDPIPNDPFCVRKDFYDAHPKISHDLMFALIELESDPKEGPRFRKLLGVSSLMLATSQQYDPVREIVKELNLTLN